MKSFVAFAMMLCAGAVSYAAAPQSGLQVGEKVPAYNVNDCTGPSAGKSLCYRCKFGARPTVNIFAREITPELVDLIKQVDQKVAANENLKMAAFVVHLTDDTEVSADQLKKVATENQGLKNIPLTNYEGAAGPSGYKIGQDADITVLMWVKGEVKVNHALKSADLNKETISKIVGDTSKILK